MNTNYAHYGNQPPALKFSEISVIRLMLVAEKSYADLTENLKNIFCACHMNIINLTYSCNGAVILWSKTTVTDQNITCQSYTMN